MLLLWWLEFFCLWCCFWWFWCYFYWKHCLINCGRSAMTAGLWHAIATHADAEAHNHTYGSMKCFAWWYLSLSSTICCRSCEWCLYGCCCSFREVIAYSRIGAVNDERRVASHCDSHLPPSHSPPSHSPPPLPPSLLRTAAGNLMVARFVGPWQKRRVLRTCFLLVLHAENEGIFWVRGMSGLLRVSEWAFHAVVVYPGGLFVSFGTWRLAVAFHDKKGVDVAVEETTIKNTIVCVHAIQ